MADSITITFGATRTPKTAKSYVVRAQTRSANAAWRQETLNKLRFVFGILESGNLGQLLTNAGAGDLAQQLRTGIGLNAILPLLSVAQNLIFEVGGLPDWIWDQVRAYSPEIAKDEKWIDDHATEGEVIEAFKAILLGLVLPLGSLGQLGGLVKLATPTNLPSANGASPTTAADLAAK